MNRSRRRYSRYGLGFLAVAFALAACHWLVSGGLLQPGAVEAKITPETAAFEPRPEGLDLTHPGVQAAMGAQYRHNSQLIDLPDVLGTATGVDEAGRPAIRVFTKRTVPPGLIPESLDGIPVAVEVTGEIFAMTKSSRAVQIDPSQRFTRPVPIGVSTGNEGECSSGTIGARVKNGSHLYALTNNHIYALENEASPGSLVLQPGRYDTQCTFDPEAVIGALADFETIDFTGANNTMDAAIASIDAMPDGSPMVDNKTPADGYGMPRSATLKPKLRQAVQKYGRASSLTKGTVTGINATIIVRYGAGAAIFVNQIVVKSKKPFIKPGDSGSLLVTDPGKNPVGLLVAGDLSGTYAIANPINAVLERFGVSIDGQEAPTRQERTRQAIKKLKRSLMGFTSPLSVRWEDLF
jgi:hypothetical protein